MIDIKFTFNFNTFDYTITRFPLVGSHHIFCLNYYNYTNYYYYYYLRTVIGLRKQQNMYKLILKRV